MIRSAAPIWGLATSIIGLRIAERPSTHCRAVAPMLKSAQTPTYPAATAYGWEASRTMGVAEGSIIAVIITAHMAHSSTRCGASQTGVIIQALAPVIGPYMSRAMTTIHSQEMSDTAISDAMRTGDGLRVITRIVERLTRPPDGSSIRREREGRWPRGE